MSDINPTQPSVYQPYGPVSDPGPAHVGRLYGIHGVSAWTTIKGLTKAEAEVVCDALKSLWAREELTKAAQSMGDY